MSPPGTSNDKRPVVITGLGCVTPVGGDVASAWQAVTAGRSGVREIARFDASGQSCRIAAEAAAELDLGGLPPKEARRLDRCVALAVAAAREAMGDAGLRVEGDGAERCGVAIGSGIGGLETLEAAHVELMKRGPRRVSPFTIPMAICNMSSGYVAIQHGLRGPNMCHVAACASGAQGIGEAMRVIQRGDADVMVAGGTESAITPVGIASFAAMRALSTRNEEPGAASRPFDRARDGFVMGEGAAVLVLESLEHARARGARIRAVVSGYAATADAMHVASPTENAEGAQRCMQLALADAGLAPGDIHYLNAHATSTPLGDASEARAIRAVFGKAVQDLAVSATKSMTGHLLGASGALEALFCVKALESGLLPPTINLDELDPECELDHVANKAREQAIETALSNSFGFGGTNATLIMSSEEVL